MTNSTTELWESTIEFVNHDTTKTRRIRVRDYYPEATSIIDIDDTLRDEAWARLEDRVGTSLFLGGDWAIDDANCDGPNSID